MHPQGGAISSSREHRKHPPKHRGSRDPAQHRPSTAHCVKRLPFCLRRARERQAGRLLENARRLSGLSEEFVRSFPVDSVSSARGTLRTLGRTPCGERPGCAAGTGATDDRSNRKIFHRLRSSSRAFTSPRCRAGAASPSDRLSKKHGLGRPSASLSGRTRSLFLRLPPHRDESRIRPPSGYDRRHSTARRPPGG